MNKEIKTNVAELTPDRFPEDFRPDWYHLLLLGKENLQRFITYWRCTERNLKRDIDELQQIEDHAGSGSFPTQIWGKGNKPCLSEKCRDCKYGTYYSFYNRKEEEIILYTCRIILEAGKIIGMDRNSKCPICLENKRLGRKIAKYARSRKLELLEEKRQVAEKIALLEYAITQADGGRPILPLLRKDKDLDGWKRLVRYDGSRWVIEQTPEHSLVPIEHEGRRKEILAQTSSYMLESELEFLLTHPGFRRLWITSICHEDVRKEWNTFFATATAAKKER